MVLSNSFHATAFSIIFNKEFYVFPVQKHKNQSRMIDLLTLVDLLDRYNPTNVSRNPIDWSVVNKMLKEHVMVSKDFLLKNLSC